MTEAVDQKIETPVVEQVVEQAPAPQIDEHEQEALEQGWKSKEEFLAEGGKEEDFKSARQFLKDTELFKRIETLNKELKSTRATLTALKGHYEKVRETEFRHALNTLKAQKKQALDNGDSDAVIEIDERIDQVKETQRAQAVQQQVNSNQVHPAFEAWVRDNNWYATDSELQDFADNIGRSYAKANPSIDPLEVLKYVSGRVKKAYPDKFKNERRTAPSAVESVRPASKAKSDDYELSEMELRVMNKLVAGGHTTKEKYIAELKAAAKQGVK